MAPLSQRGLRTLVCAALVAGVWCVGGIGGDAVVVMLDDDVVVLTVDGSFSRSLIALPQDEPMWTDDESSGGMLVTLRLFAPLVKRNVAALAEYRGACVRCGCTVLVVFDTTNARAHLQSNLDVLRTHTAPHSTLAAARLEVVNSDEVERAFKGLARPSAGADLYQEEREESLCHNFGVFCLLAVLGRVRTANAGAAASFGRSDLTDEGDADARRAGHHPLLSAAHVWVIEDDARYSGDVAEFFAKYQGKGEDLVSAYIGPPEASWPSTAEESWDVPRDDVVAKVEHVERFSRKLLDEMLDLAELSVVGMGELFASTVCAHLKWCTIADLVESSDVGGKFDWNTTVSSEEWRAIMASTATQGKWWHALKGEWYQ